MNAPKATTVPTPDDRRPDSDRPQPATESTTFEDIQVTESATLEDIRTDDLDGVAGGFNIVYRPDAT